MEERNYINKILRKSCVYFTIIVFIYALIVALVNSPANQVLLDAERLILFFIFSFIISLANGILAAKNISRPLAVLFHYILSMIATYLCLILPLSPRASTAVVGISLFSIIYFVAMGIVAITRTVAKRRKEKKEDYKEHFKK